VLRQSDRHDGTGRIFCGNDVRDRRHEQQREHDDDERRFDGCNRHDERNDR